MNYNALKLELETPEFTGKTDEQILTIFNEPVLNGLDYREWPDINNYANNNGLIKILDRVINAPSSAELDTVNESIDYSVREIAKEGFRFLTVNTTRPVNPNNEKLNLLVGALQIAGIYTAEQITAFWNVFRIPTTRAKSTYGRDLEQKDLNIARLYDQWQDENNELSMMNEAVADKTFRVFQLSQGIDPDVEV